jgi:hypothetical protein
MIVCSCRILCTQKIKACMESLPNPTVQNILKELNWTPDCKTCAKNIVKEITNLLEQRQQ